MGGSTTYEGGVAGFRGVVDTRTLFGQTMWLVAITTGFFALGAYLGRSLSYGWGWIWFIASLACLIAMRPAVRSASSAAIGLLFGFGLLVGLGTAPTIAYYASTNPQVVWQAGAATALFMTALGAVGYATRRDLSALGRVSFWGLIALILFGIVAILFQLPNGSLIYAIAGLVIFAGLTMFDFQRLRRGGDLASAPLTAASIFLDALNVFLFFLRIFSRQN
ncbi:Bax inhibitor-1/YccA family protein [Mycobacterium sp.]|uniref:Bax inhibitor-1/YccA family protein n=1 Tax=Mycobacterium sp. TaxID=1785 RepID=UPI002BE36426|nr:Bax inhibitor-1 family protein [Mycobacterium sp.]HTQ21321.1 Bax inhibitor-1 family protein [Mycobacterium sp.]